jgi:hypothetical protein
VAPPGLAGTVDLTVSVDDPATTATQRFNGSTTFTYYASPNVVSITPPLGPFSGGTNVTIRGSSGVRSYGDQVQVIFGSDIVNATVVSDGILVCTTPDDSATNSSCKETNGTVCATTTIHPQILLNGQQATSDAVDFHRYSHPKLERFKVNLPSNPGSVSSTQPLKNH